MHVHTLRKPVRAVASLQETEWENAEVVQTQRHLSSLAEVSVDAANTLCLFFATNLEKRQTPPSNSPFILLCAKPSGLDFTPLRITENKICSGVENHNVATSDLSHSGLYSGIP